MRFREEIAEGYDDDPICSAGGGNGGAHGMYAANGMVGQAAQFAVKQV
ncbi:MAG TPA: hypothetical protein VIJ23_16785 [Mycobacterium sp.]